MNFYKTVDIRHKECDREALRRQPNQTTFIGCELCFLPGVIEDTEIIRALHLPQALTPIYGRFVHTETTLMTVQFHMDGTISL
jgi:hypothetical protein